MPPDASDFPGGIPALQCTGTIRAYLIKHRWAFLLSYSVQGLVHRAQIDFSSILPSQEEHAREETVAHRHKRNMQGTKRWPTVTRGTCRGRNGGPPSQEEHAGEETVAHPHKRNMQGKKRWPTVTRGTCRGRNGGPPSQEEHAGEETVAHRHKRNMQGKKRWPTVTRGIHLISSVPRDCRLPHPN